MPKVNIRRLASDRAQAKKNALARQNVAGQARSKSTMFNGALIDRDIHGFPAGLGE
jgi:hypothetical protein